MDALSTSVPIVRIAASAAEADPAANVIAPVPGDRESCLAYVAGGESSLPPSYDVDRGIDTFGPGYYKRLARTLTHLKAMVAAYRLDAPAVLISDANENPVTHPDFSFWADPARDDALPRSSPTRAPRTRAGGTRSCPCSRSPTPSARWCRTGPRTGGRARQR